MKLEHMFFGTLTSPKNGLFLLAEKITESCNRIKDAVESGKLEELRAMLAEGHECVRSLDAFLTHTESKIANFTTNENGKIIDLSVSPDQRN